MAIADDDIAKVRDATDIVELITRHVALRRVGRRWQGLCPFHDERTPSFSVNAEEGLYHCFGCKRSGDAISFVQETEHLDFPDAVAMLADRVGITLHYTTPDEGRQRSRRSELSELVARAVDYYHAQLIDMDNAEARPAREYLRSRGYSGDTAREFKLGWAPDDWDALCRALRIPEKDLVDSGLGYVNRRGRPQDAFRARVMFPIFDERGNAVGFGGRQLPDGPPPKYKNTSGDALVYDKSRVLYGLHRHKAEITRAQEVVVCEGYTDVIGFATAGIERAVATCGTALTEQHVQLLRKFGVERLILAFDADAAGQSATARVYEWEQRHGVEVAVAALPDDRDPGDLARDDPELLHAAIEDPAPLMRFRLGRVFDAADLSTPEHRARAAEQAVAIIAEHPSGLVRDQYLIEVADRCRVNVDQLRRRAADPPRERPSTSDRRRRTEEPPLREPPPDHVGSPDDGPSPHAPTPPAIRTEDEALRLLVVAPEVIGPFLRGYLFTSPVHRAAVEAVLGHRDLHAAIDDAGPEVAELLRTASVTEPVSESLETVAMLAGRVAERVLAGLRIDATGPDAAAYVESIGWLKHRIEDLREATTRKKAIEQLLPWLDEHGQGRLDDG